MMTKEQAKELLESLKSENGGRVNEYLSLDQMDEDKTWYSLYFELKRFIEEVY